MNTPSPLPDKTHLQEGLDHIHQALEQGHIATGAAKGLLFSLTETLGVLLGDPALPDQMRDGYEGLLETARELYQHLHTPRSP
ncbi:MAG: hypothetical protein G3H99_00940 [Ferrovum sp.]|jgi:hypothetical protein|nr:hypothetical protein [Ferrovum sp.]NDU86743.1 hypothetical protein [Ferrovum sp.]